MSQRGGSGIRDIMVDKKIKLKVEIYPNIFSTDLRRRCGVEM